MAEHMDFIHDEYLSDNMVFVLFSPILMVNNPLLLLEILALAFHVERIVKHMLTSTPPKDAAQECYNDNNKEKKVTNKETICGGNAATFRQMNAEALAKVSTSA
uniref:Uncharacterized protein n=1 Tax=Glossina austeni TaxID=7395 RepID=A0A1A9VX45_GLOAU